MKKNAHIYTIDNSLKNGTLTFSEACKCYHLVRKGRTAEEALTVINNRKNKKEEKKYMKQSKKNNDASLETLVEGLLKRISLEHGDGWLVDNNDLGYLLQDALSYVGELPGNESSWGSSNSSPLVLDQLNKLDNMELCYDNTEGAESLFY